MYPSLKAHLGDKCKRFRKADSVCGKDSRLCKSSRRLDKQFLVVEPSLAFSNHSSIGANSQNSPGENGGVRPLVHLARKATSLVRDWRSESVRCLVTIPKTAHEPETSGQQQNDKIGCLRAIDEGILNTIPNMLDNQFLGHSPPGFENAARDPIGFRNSGRVVNPLGKERNCTDNAPDKSYFHTSSDSDNESIRRSSCLRIMSKIKTSTSGWIRDAFTLDEHEKAFFEFRKNIFTDWNSQKYSPSVCTDGGRVVRSS